MAAFVVAGKDSSLSISDAFRFSCACLRSISQDLLDEYLGSSLVYECTNRCKGCELVALGCFVLCSWLGSTVERVAALFPVPMNFFVSFHRLFETQVTGAICFWLKQTSVY